MNKKDYEQKVLTPLKAWTYLGEIKSEADAQLLGHVPHIAPKAYMHLVYAPLNDEDLIKLEKQIERKLPEQLKKFYEFANGIDIFSGGISLFGYFPYERKFKSHPHNYPGDIQIPNVQARIKGMHEVDVIIASYKWDSSIAIIEEDGSVVRYDIQNGGQVVQTWPDFDTWITSEIEHYSQFFDENGKMMGDGKDVFAPHN